MPATSSTCSVKGEEEWKKEEEKNMEDWGFPPSEVIENDEVSDQGQNESIENQGQHFNYGYSGVS